MKKLAILFLVISFKSSFSQLTLISGGSSPINNGSVFTLGVPTGAPISSSFTWNLTYDAGTQVYAIDNPQIGYGNTISGGFDIAIFWHNNYWKIVGFSGVTHTMQEYYETVGQYNSPNPPCSALWKKMHSLDQPYYSPQFSIPLGSISLLTFSGVGTACNSTPPIICSISAQCEGIQMAPIDYNTLNTLNVQAGFISYDAIKNAPTYFDGNSWNTLTTIGKGPNINPIKNISSSYTVFNDEYVLVYNGTGTHTITIPPASQTIGRTLSIINISSTSSININPPILNASSSIGLGGKIMIISDGTNWLKMN